MNGAWPASADAAAAAYQNLSHRLLTDLPPRFAGSLHVRDVGLARADDRVVWNYAQGHDLTIVSKDGDFHHPSLLQGAPPKIVWLAVGNCSTSEVASLLAKSADRIAAFVGATADALLVIGPATQSIPRSRG